MKHVSNHFESVGSMTDSATSARREIIFSLRMYEVMPGDIVVRPKSKPVAS
jgi:hypothetical protein